MFFKSATVCKALTIFIGVSELCVMDAPVGTCAYCCARQEADVLYKLFTRRNPTSHQLLTPGPGGVAGTHLDPADPTVIYLMGFSETTTGASTTALRDGARRIGFRALPSSRGFTSLSAATDRSLVDAAYLSAGSFNFIAVDWSRLIAFPWYVTAVRNTRYMGSQLAGFVRRLEAAGVPAATVHVLGFSLGAEAAGFAGKTLRRERLLLGRITGLDPAYPGYGLTDSDGHLSRGDAAFVDVIHTNPGVFGFPEPIGDVDFYPNPGSWIQPGCWLGQLLKNNEIGYLYGCSHNRAWRLYAESVRRPRAFPATLCRRWPAPCPFTVDGYMGLAAAPPMKGKMYLKTNQKPPFGRDGP